MHANLIIVKNLFTFSQTSQQNATLTTVALARFTDNRIHSERKKKSSWPKAATEFMYIESRSLKMNDTQQ